MPSATARHALVSLALPLVLLLGCTPEELLPWSGNAESIVESATDDLPLEPELRSRITAVELGLPVTAAGEAIHATIALPRFYAENGYEPVWIVDGRLSGEGQRLLEALRSADDDGLDPADYHLAALDSVLTRLDDGNEETRTRHRVDMEILLSDGFLLLGAHLLHGRVDPVTVEPAWTASRNGVDMGNVMASALNGSGVTTALESLRPSALRYERMREELRGYREIVAQGGWESVPPGPTLDPGTSDPRIRALRARLSASGHLQPAAAGAGTAPEYYDDALAEAVRRFQISHGLTPDARVGSATLGALNVPAEHRTRQLVLNLERWRWLPRELGDRYILVNIPGFSVSVVDGGQETFRLRAVVGRHYRATPVFSGRMTYLALAPYWNVPPGIAANDQLPRIRADPGHVAAQHMTLFDNATNRTVDPHSIEWTGMTGAEFNRRFRLRQEPGAHNALGDVKFMFPNRHNVYLHDSPARDLFALSARDFSSGCVRVERPLELTAHLLRDAPGWTAERIQQTIRGGREQAVTLPHAYDVHLQYWTAWVDRDGTLNFRPDIYDRDDRLRRALEIPAPRAGF